MIKRSCVLMLLITLFIGANCFASPPQDEKYYKVLDDSQLNVYFDSRSLEVVKDEYGYTGNIIMWLYTDYYGDALKEFQARNKKADHMLTKEIYDVKNSRRIIVAIKICDKENKILMEADTSNLVSWKNIESGSNDDVILKNILEWMDKDANK